MATRVRSYSKINLGLAIGPVRADGFHGLATLYQTLALHDVVTVEAKPGSRFEVRGSREAVSVRRGQPDVGHSRSDYADDESSGGADGWAEYGVEDGGAGAERMGVAAEVKIHIQKELPVQGGLGAGSANAAAALIGLERELGFTLSELARMEMAAEVGSDVPLFLLGGAVLGTGRGERVRAMPDLPATWCVVAVPEVGVSTPRAFQEWDALQATGNREQGTEVRGTEVQGIGSREPETEGGLTSPVRPDRLEELSHVYASVFGPQNV